MKQYEYKFVRVNKITGLRARNGDTFKEVKKIIRTETEQGWRLKQVVIRLSLKEKFNYVRSALAGCLMLCIKSL